MQLKEEGDIYDEVDEEGYAAVMEKRRADGDFIEDDGASASR